MRMCFPAWRFLLRMIVMAATASVAPLAPAAQNEAAASETAPADPRAGAGTAEQDPASNASADDSGGSAPAPKDIDPAAADDATAEGHAYSEAETILWLTDQLKNIEKPVRLNYEFRKAGSLEEGFTDSVQLEITDMLPDGMKKANVNFLTGARQHHVPPYESINGNPLLAIYLHGDVLEMKRLTDGGWRYFHRRIKHAFAEAAEITPVDVDFDGRQLRAKQVKVTPYVDDPQAETSEKLHRLRNKVYLFTVSDDIPGYLYEIRTVVPAEKTATDPAEPLLEESLRLVAVEDL